DSDEESQQQASCSSRGGHNSVTPSTSPGIKPHATSHLTGIYLAFFNTMSARADLDEESCVLARKLCNASSGENQFIACIVGLAAARQEIRGLRSELAQRFDAMQDPTGRRGPTNAIGHSWKATKELRGYVRLSGFQCILAGDVQAYTATENHQGEQDVLPLSLYAKVMSSILSNPGEWKKRIVTVPASNANVPTIDTLIVKLYQKERGLVGGRVRVREEILENVNHLRTTRYAWLRMQAIHWGLNRQAYSNKSFWDVVDNKLEDLRARSRRYRYAYFLSVLQDDYDRIDGNKNFQQLKETCDFAMPTNERIEANIQELNVTFGDEIAPDEAGHEEIADDTE
ncbi:hypothetical protein DFH28DRAFT_898028, partial [Melampsora americana]